MTESCITCEMNLAFIIPKWKPAWYSLEQTTLVTHEEARHGKNTPNTSESNNTKERSIGLSQNGYGCFIRIFDPGSKRQLTCFMDTCFHKVLNILSQHIFKRLAKHTCIQTYIHINTPDIQAMVSSLHCNLLCRPSSSSNFCLKKWPAS